MLTAHE
jgi:hypothetical protein